MMRISACTACGERYPTSPPGTIHKCGKCPGQCQEIEHPTLDDLLAVGPPGSVMLSYNQPSPDEVPPAKRGYESYFMTFSYNGVTEKDLDREALVKLVGELSDEVYLLRKRLTDQSLAHMNDLAAFARGKRNGI